MRALMFALAAGTALMSPIAAQAGVSFGLGDNGVPGTPATVNLNSTLGSVGIFTGGAVYQNSVPSEAARPANSTGNFYSVAPSATTTTPQSSSPGTLTFTTNINYVSFLWGSPDQYNTLTVTTNLNNTIVVTPGSGLGSIITPSSGDQAAAPQVYFQTTSAGEFFKTFTYSSTQNAFETGNYRVAAVPGPLAGAGLIPLLGLAGAMVARRRREKLAA